jgi:hypothetical protein
MLVPARGSAPLRGCYRKGLRDSSLRAPSGYAGKGKSGPSGLLHQNLKLCLPVDLRGKNSIWRGQNVREFSA